MTPELVEKIYAVAPQLYKEKDWPPQKSLMAFGLAVGDGWYQLIFNLSVELEARHSEEFPVTAIQVKEKYGGLRFYVGYASDEMQKLIDEAESASYTICEDCGAPGKASGNAWIRTLCEKCRGTKN